MKLLIIESSDQDKFGIDTQLMVVEDNYDKRSLKYDAVIKTPIIVDTIPVDDITFSTLINLGSRRPFVG